MRRLRPALAFALALPLCGCEDQSYREIGREVSVLVRRDDGLVPPAQERLAAFGRRALPQIETAMHTAPLHGRLALIEVLDRISDEEAVPVLRHFAVYDSAPEVRESCEAVLKGWSVRSDVRAEKARVALAAVADRRAHGAGPLGPRAAPVPGD
jgi:hypothetical protein